jgi:Mlc titration factor MtfA (ptsG expression regulator)
LFLFDYFKRHRRERVLRQTQIDDAVWNTALEDYNFTRVLNADERVRLKQWVILFLAEKPINGAGDLNIDNGARLAIAIQACMLILNLDLDWYKSWTEVIIYPGEFVARHEEIDEAGVVHVVEEPMSGESWEHGTVVLSWADVQQAGQAGNDGAYNVVMHEFAHQMDMLNGDANGFPPLHKDMNREQWAKAFSAAYEHFCNRVDAWEDTVIDEYASENPAEFFAVISEAFFETPLVIQEAYPDVYAQLALFYRQDTAARARANASIHDAA